MSQISHSKERKFEIKDALKCGLAGGCAGIGVDFIIFPLDTIKTRIQASSLKQNYKKGAENISKYRGLLAMMTCSFPCAAAFFLTYDFTKFNLYKCTNKEKRLLPFIHVLSALCGGLADSVIRTPFEVIKQNLQIGKYNSSINATKSIMSTSGLSGLYRGFLSMQIRDIPFNIIQFPLYEYLKSRNKLKIGNVKDGINGSIAGSLSGLLTNPIDIIKTRMMTNTEKESIYNCVRRIGAEDGITGYFRGAGMRMSYLGFGGFGFFMINESVKRAILQQNPIQNYL